MRMQKKKRNRAHRFEGGSVRVLQLFSATDRTSEKQLTRIIQSALCESQSCGLRYRQDLKPIYQADIKFRLDTWTLCETDPRNVSFRYLPIILRSVPFTLCFP